MPCRKKTARRKFENGDMVEVVANNTGHTIPIGSILTVTNRQNGYYMTQEYPNFWIMPRDLEAVASTIDALEGQAEKKEQELMAVKEKIAYLKDTGQEKFCLQEFKAYQTLKVLEDSMMSTLDRAKAIARLYDK